MRLMDAKRMFHFGNPYKKLTSNNYSKYCIWSLCK